MGPRPPFLIRVSLIATFVVAASLILSFTAAYVAAYLIQVPLFTSGVDVDPLTCVDEFLQLEQIIMIKGANKPVGALLC